MKLHSGFFFTGGSVLAGIAFVSEAWPMLLLALFVLFFGLVLADREQLAGLDARVAEMFLPRCELPLLPFEGFTGEGLIGYRAGYPVYRVLRSRDARWQLLGTDDEVNVVGNTIRVCPGLIYRRLED
ncbi:hypothetical protein [Crenobacter cavernae]|uniref:NfeD-like C-terminal domain-containing protein n=1 Tax=Crenobacter cavernae TaxID=2290923 RepID=A0ABY0FED3_9NEIS|nr:hypothetical protein [Crenobacter cavernae]RXZ44587.1 hypothetical protein EBB06_05685 [Crenobacter cavernae]